MSWNLSGSGQGQITSRDRSTGPVVHGSSIRDEPVRQFGSSAVASVDVAATGARHRLALDGMQQGG